MTLEWATAVRATGPTPVASGDPPATAGDSRPDSSFSWVEFLERADLYPSHLNLREGKLVLARLTRDGYRRVNFLGAEVERLALQQTEVAVSELLSRRRSPALRRQPFRAVFHTAFCGSTLLSRALDALGAFVLKEPHILVEICDLRRSALPTTAGCTERLTFSLKRVISRLIGSGQMRSSRWTREVQATMLDLLARPFHGEEPVVVKLNDCCNELMTELTPRMGLFLYGTLTDFLTAVLKATERREWMRRRFHCYQAVARRLGVLPEGEPSPAADHRMAAILWATYIKLFCAAAAGGKLRALSFTSLMNDPLTVVTKVCEYFEMPMPESAIQAVVNSDVFRFHAKNRTNPFDDRDRKLLNARLRQEFRAEIDEAVAWLTPFHDPDLPLPCPLVL